MTKKLVFFLIIATIVSGCKVKQKTSYVDPVKKGPKVIIDKRTIESSQEIGLHPLPNDIGKFQKIKIGSISEYIDTFSEIAQNEMKTFGIPASITLAQGLLESGFGKGELAAKTNNHFGIKCHKGWQGDFDFHDDDEKGECFRKYNHPMYSFRDHSHFLTTRSRYSFLFELRRDDYKKWAKGLSKAGYATDRKYAQKLISIIEKYQLYKYDNIDIDAKELALTSSVIGNKHRTYIVKRGDTLYSISKKYAISVDHLKHINKISDTSLSIGQKLIIETK